MITENIDINEFYWGVKTKFKLEVGLKNELTNQYKPTESNVYPEIVWFLQGVYIVTTFNTSITTNNCTISLSGKDKMCMLNGDLGGQLFASIDFGTEETEVKSMKSVSNLSSVSSDILMTNIYYKKLEEEDLNKPQEVFSSDSLYSFILSENGIYYKNGNKYCYITEDITVSKKYDIYKKVTNPNELFNQIEVTNENYQKDKYYYEKFQTKQYYILDSGSTKSANRVYYELIPLYQEEYSYNIVQIPLEKIIRESVHTYAKEPYYNIIINDLDDYGLEQLTYKGDVDLYALRNAETGHFTQLVFSGKNQSLDGCINNSFVFDALNPVANSDSTKIYCSNHNFNLINFSDAIAYTVAKISYGEDIGYRVVDLVYNGDLISAIGDSLVTILDKIKTMLGDFEYFYDLYGRFIFQRKRTYVNTSWSKLTKTEDEDYVDYINSDRRKFSFNFEGNRLITAIQNSPNLANLKNDFSVWGKRKSISGAEIPIHARYAIDKKPVYYKALNGKVFVVDEIYAEEQQETSYIVVDWRELIYQMALDYFAGQGCSIDQPVYLSDGGILVDPDHFLYEVGQRNLYYYPTGITGYEQYYTDMEGFWRQLYNPDYIPVAKYQMGEYTTEIIESEENSHYFSKIKKWSDMKLIDYDIDYYINANNTDIETQYNDLLELISSDDFDEDDLKTFQDLKDKYNMYQVDMSSDNEDKKDRLYWNVAVFEAPETLNFWIEFLDSGTELAQFQIPMVGDRSKAINEDKAGAIIYKEIPDIILYDVFNAEGNKADLSNIRKEISENTGYTFVYLPKGFSQYLTISYRNKSVKDKVDELLYDFAYCTESISITALPIYHLEPNTRIYVQDNTTKINGEYIINKITLPLTYNGTMSITAIKAQERLY